MLRNGGGCWDSVRQAVIDDHPSDYRSTPQLSRLKQRSCVQSLLKPGIDCETDVLLVGKPKQAMR